MRSPDQFDEFYKNTRDRLLLQTFALTGDLRASRSAVRDAFVLAWHHWRKVKRQDDREAWLRPHAWSDARRRHNARLWHRDRTLDAATKETLDALGKLSLQQRRIVVLTQLSATPMPEIAREVGVTLDEAERLLQAATAAYAVQRGTTSQLRPELNALGAVTGSARLPRASIIRRAGTARRRAFTAVGVSATVIALLGAGTFVSDPDGPAHPGAGPTESTSNEPEIALASEVLLTTTEVGRLATGPWTATPGGENTEGTGINTPCQADRFADPAGMSSLVRRFSHPKSKNQPEMNAVQTAELSRTARTATSTFATTVGWYAGCSMPGVQLVSSYAVGGVGDQARLFVLRRTGTTSVNTYTVAVARTGMVTTSLFASVPGRPKPPVAHLKALVTAAVTRLCGTPGAGTCASTPTIERSLAPPVGDTPGLLEVIDLAPPGKVTKPWTATEAKRATVNLATVACDGTVFHQKQVTGDMTRSYLILKAGLVARFGMTETVGTLGTQGAARGFVNGVRKRMATCEKKFLASEVTRLADQNAAGTDLAAWQITTEVGAKGQVDVLMAIVRRGNNVAQIGFVMARNATYDRATFLAVASRAIERLSYLPKKS